LGSLALETYHFKEPTNRSYPICITTLAVRGFKDEICENFSKLEINFVYVARDLYFLWEVQGVFEVLTFQKPQGGAWGLISVGVREFSLQCPKGLGVNFSID